MPNLIILLDTTPLGLVTHPRPGTEALACKHWLQGHITQGTRIIVPEISDYELRRELLRARRQQGLNQLNALIQRVKYLELTTDVMKRAAEFWAQARQQGIQTAHDAALDGDMILAAQADLLNDPHVIVATANVKHLARFVPADHWRNI